jgi:hypothetical protein
MSQPTHLAEGTPPGLNLRQIGFGGTDQARTGVGEECLKLRCDIASGLNVLDQQQSRYKRGKCRPDRGGCVKYIASSECTGLASLQPLQP